MDIIDTSTEGQPSPDRLPTTDPIAAGESVLARAKLVARQITERVRKLTGDTELDHNSLASDGTDTQPSLP